MSDLIDCPWPPCSGGVVATRQDPVTGQWDDAPCPICDGSMGVTQDEADRAMERMDVCPACRRYIDDCYCNRKAGMGDKTEYVTGLVFNLRDLLADARLHGVYARVDVYAELEGSAFDGLAACADSVKAVPTLGTGPAIRAATWTAGRDGAVPASEVSLVERRRAA